MPTDLNTKSYFINLFTRAFIWAESSNTRVFYKFLTGPNDADSVSPANPGVLDNQKIQLS